MSTSESLSLIHAGDFQYRLLLFLPSHGKMEPANHCATSFSCLGCSPRTLHATFVSLRSFRTPPSAMKAGCLVHVFYVCMDRAVIARGWCSKGKGGNNAVLCEALSCVTAEC